MDCARGILRLDLTVRAECENVEQSSLSLGVTTETRVRYGQVSIKLTHRRPAEF